jgi:hypothetical protein
MIRRFTLLGFLALGLLAQAQGESASAFSSSLTSGANSTLRRILQGFGVGAIVETASPTSAPTSMGVVVLAPDLDWVEFTYSFHYRLYTNTESATSAAESQFEEQLTDGLGQSMAELNVPVSIEQLVSLPLGKIISLTAVSILIEMRANKNSRVIVRMPLLSLYRKM